MMKGKGNSMISKKTALKMYKNAEQTISWVKNRVNISQLYSIDNPNNIMGIAHSLDYTLYPVLKKYNLKSFTEQLQIETAWNVADKLLLDIRYSFRAGLLNLTTYDDVWKYNKERYKLKKEYFDRIWKDLEKEINKHMPHQISLFDKHLNKK